MTDKKTEVITFRTEPWVKNRLQEIANQNHWTIAQTVNQVCTNFIVEPKPNEITIKSEDFIRAAKEIRQEGTDKGVELRIAVSVDEENQCYYKELIYDIIECGGLGAIGCNSAIREMTENEILDIP